MTLYELLLELETMETNCDLQLEIKGIKNDSRKVKPGDIFVAISGAEQDGHIYIPKAMEQGAAVIVSEKPLGNSRPYVVVPDTRAALPRLASAFYGHPSRKLRMVGVTGTKGKTTVTHLIKALLDTKGGAGLIGTNHVLIGDKEQPSERTTPDAVALHGLFDDMVKEGCKSCVMEVSSHALAQRRTAGIFYHTSVFTNLSRDHLDYHADMEEYFKAKCMLFKQSGGAVINIDDPYGARLAGECSCPVLAYSAKGSKADLTAGDIELLPDRVRFTAGFEGARERIVWKTPGMFSVYNALAAIGAGLREGFTLAEIAPSLAEAPAVPGRFEVVPVPAPFTVVIDYAHSPDALENALETARGVTKGRVIALFGCGGDRDSGKRPIMGRLAARLADIVVLTSDNPRTENPRRIIDDILCGMTGYKPLIEENRAKAIGMALSAAGPGDMVLLCGKGHETYQEVFGQHYPMDERQIVAAFWAKEDEGEK